MVSFKDMTFCNAKDCEHFGDREIDPDLCFRSLTDKVKKEAEEWYGNDQYPIRIFTEKPECYTPKSVEPK